MPADFHTLFQIAMIGIAVAMIHTVLKAAGKEEFASWITLVGVVIILFMVVNYVSDLFTKITSVFRLK